MVREQYRLSALQMGVSGDNQVLVSFSLTDDRLLQTADQASDGVDRFSQEEPLVESNLIIAAAGSMKFPPNIPDFLDQSRFNRHMNILPRQTLCSLKR